MDASIFNASGLSKAELANLFGVSRVTIHSWMAGKFSPHPLHRAEVESRVNALRRAVDSGALPLSEGIDRHLRAAAATAAIESHL